jgi:hypothetical protein
MQDLGKNTPFDRTPLDGVMSNDAGAFKSVADVGEAYLANLLRAELAPLQAAHQEGEDAFHETLGMCRDTVALNRPLMAGDPGADDFWAAVARSCTVLAYGQTHRLFRHLMAFLRARLGRHLLARPDLVKATMDDPVFAKTFGACLGRLNAASGRSPVDLFQTEKEPPAGATSQSRCAFCDRHWTGQMPKLQHMPAELEVLDDWDPTASGREAVIELADKFYRVQLDSNTPLQSVCNHGHIAHLLLHGNCAVFDPWFNVLAIGFLEPEMSDPVVTGWKRYDP